jgi:hypothetical protein
MGYTMTSYISDKSIISCLALTFYLISANTNHAKGIALGTLLFRAAIAAIKRIWAVIADF